MCESLASHSAVCVFGYGRPTTTTVRARASEKLIPSERVPPITDMRMAPAPPWVFVVVEVVMAVVKAERISVVGGAA